MLNLYYFYTIFRIFILYTMYTILRFFLVQILNNKHSKFQKMKLVFRQGETYNRQVHLKNEIFSDSNKFNGQNSKPDNKLDRIIGGCLPRRKDDGKEPAGEDLGQGYSQQWAKLIKEFEESLSQGKCERQ